MIKIKVSDLPDKGIRHKHKSDVSVHVFAHVCSIEKRQKKPSEYNNLVIARMLIKWTDFIHQSTV